MLCITGSVIMVLFQRCTQGSPLNNGDVFWFNKYVHLFLCNEDYSVANCIDCRWSVSQRVMFTSYVSTFSNPKMLSLKFYKANFNTFLLMETSFIFKNGGSSWQICRIIVYKGQSTRYNCCIRFVFWHMKLSECR